MELKVLKRAGEIEEFSISKIKKAVIRAGGTAKLAEYIALNTTKWAEGTAKDGMVSAIDINGKVLEILYEKNKEVADKFKSFLKKH